MPSPPTIETLTELAEALSRAMTDLSAEISSDAGRLAERLEQGGFEIAVVGEFKRGKSTLIDALVGRPLLPTGVLPLTAVATEVRHGPDGLTVTFNDGRQEHHPASEVATFVTEDRNPGNERGVARAVITVESDLLASGLVLVDTPGLGSVHSHNTQAAEAELDRLAGAIVVLSAEAPFSEREAALVERLVDRSVRTFFVLNRVDALDDAEVGVVAEFVRTHLAEVFGRVPELYCLSARDALTAKQQSQDISMSGFADFERAIRNFAIDELAAARLQAGCHDLKDLARRADEILRVQTALLRLERDELDERSTRLTEAIAAHQAGLENDVLLLRHDRDEIGRALAATLARAGHAMPTDAPARLADVASRAPAGEVEAALDDAVEAIVRSRVDAVRAEQETWCNTAWHSAAGAFRARVQHRVDDLRAEAGRLFQITFDPLAVPAIPDERERFFYLFLHLETTNAPIARAGRRLLPRSWVARQLRRRALRRLERDLDKHAGRVRVDLSQRLDDACQHYVTAIRERFASVTTDLVTALELGRDRSTDIEARRTQHDVEAKLIRVLTSAIGSLPHPDPRPAEEPPG